MCLSLLSRAVARRLRGESGAAMVEFALVLPLLMTLVLGLMDFGKALNYWIDQTHLSNEAARWAVVNRNPGADGSQTLQQYIKGQADSADLRDATNGASVCIDFPNGAPKVGDPVRVRIQYSYNWLPFFQNRLGFTATTIAGTATMRLEAMPTNYSAADNIGSCS
jgi:Flp pilus assembly pilin Flp